ncbi:MAG TPA: hypothetical protein VGM87_03025 [Roseomonas sp.]|jgi:hypothetical protein
MTSDREADQDTYVADRSAIVLILGYVESECRRLGALAAAEHAALAASLVPDDGHVAPAPVARPH